MEREAEDYIAAVKKWILTEKERMYNEILKTETGKATDLSRYENQIAELGKQLLRAIEGEKKEDLEKLGWPQELIDCILDPSVNLVICHFIELACVRFPNSNSLYSLKKLEEKQNIGLG